MACVAMAAGVALPVMQAAETSPAALEIVRATYAADRQAAVTVALQLTDAESARFWPLYADYRAEWSRLGDDLLAWVADDRSTGRGLTESQARARLDQYCALEERLTRTRARYLKKALKCLPARKALRWAQTENRLDIAFRLKIAQAMPLISTDPEPR